MKTSPQTTIEIPTVANWPQALQLWSKTLQGNEVLLLEGDLGSGKTTFVTALVRLLNTRTPSVPLSATATSTATGTAADTVADADKSPVASPTYSLHHQYMTPRGLIDHWDLYRIRSLEELESSGFWEILNQAQSLVIVEWPQIVPATQWPDRRPILNLSFKFHGQGRKLTISES